MAWRWITFENAKSHACPEELRHALVHEMEHLRRSAHPMRKETALVDLHFDYGGACITTAPREIIMLDGLRVTLWCDEVAMMRGDLQRELPRRFQNRAAPYFKFHGAHRCIVLTLRLRNAFVDALAEREIEATQKWIEFRNRWRKP